MSSIEAPSFANSTAEAAGAEIPTASAKVARASAIRMLALVVLISVALSVRSGVEGENSSRTRCPSLGRREGDSDLLLQLPLAVQRLLGLRAQPHLELVDTGLLGGLRRLLQALAAGGQLALAGDLDAE